MTRVRTLIGAESFRTAIADALALDDDSLAALRAGIEQGDDPSPDLPAKALQVLFEAALESDADVVLDEVRAGMPGLDRESLARLDRAIRPDAASQRRYLGIRQRDAYLPILVNSRFSLDLRIVGDVVDRDLAPVVTARLMFDEPVGAAGEAIVVQVPTAMLLPLAGELERLHHQIGALRGPVDGFTVPDWASA